MRTSAAGLQAGRHGQSAGEGGGGRQGVAVDVRPVPADPRASVLEAAVSAVVDLVVQRLVQIVRPARRLCSPTSAGIRSRCGPGSDRQATDAIRSATMALTAGPPTHTSLRRCWEAHTMALAATSGWKIGGTGWGRFGIRLRLQSNCGELMAGSRNRDVDVAAVVHQLGQRSDSVKPWIACLAPQ